MRPAASALTSVSSPASSPALKPALGWRARGAWGASGIAFLGLGLVWLKAPVTDWPFADWLMRLAILLAAVPIVAWADFRLGSAPRPVRLLGTLALAIWAMIPFAVVYWMHFGARLGQAPGTGLIHWDMLCYVANGREIFERGDGVLYPNPYDDSADPPIIYFQWHLWLLGGAVVWAGIDPGLAMLGGAALAGLACSILTLKLVERLAPGRGARAPLFLLVIWGGGLLALGRIFDNLRAGSTWDDAPFAYDPFNGWWFLNWGRNLLFPTEALYHALVAGCWLAVAWGRHGIATACALALAAAHPWSGFQHLLILNVWLALCCLTTRGQRDRWTLAAAVLGLAVFCGYYLAFLPSHPQHQRIQHAFELDWTPSAATIVWGHGPAMALALARLVAEGFRKWRTGRSGLRAVDGFLLLSFAGSFLLANHHWFIKPRQPIHFDRGFVIAPLLLFSLPMLADLGRAVARWLPQTLLGVGLTIGLTASSSDNIFWIASISHYEQIGCPMPADQRVVLQYLDREANPSQEALCQDVSLSRYLPAYTPLQSYYGHEYNQDGYEERKAQADRFFAGHLDAVPLDRIDWIIVRKDAEERVRNEFRGRYAEARRTLGFVILRRISPP